MITVATFFLFAAVVMWSLGFFHAKFGTFAPDWLCGGLACAGIGLWLASLIK